MNYKLIPLCMIMVLIVGTIYGGPSRGGGSGLRQGSGGQGRGGGGSGNRGSHARTAAARATRPNVTHTTNIGVRGGGVGRRGRGMGRRPVYPIGAGYGWPMMLDDGFSDIGYNDQSVQNAPVQNIYSPQY